MKILENYPELEGKTIAFTHMAQFAEQITIATTDGCVLMAKFDYNYDNEDFGSGSEIQILGKHRVLHILESDRGKYIREALGAKGIFDLAAFKERERVKHEKEQEERKLKAAELEKLEYERLKAKFESK